MDAQAIVHDEASELEQLEAIETGWGPQGESALLMELLKQSPELSLRLTDPAEVPNGHSPLAELNAYKHRLQALRGEYADARLHGIEVEEQLAEARLQILRLEARVKHLDITLQRIFASRFWKFRELCAGCWHFVLRRLLNRNRSTVEAAPLSNRYRSDG